MTDSYNLSFGALSPDIEDQLRPQGFTLAGSANRIHRIDRYITFLGIHEILTESERMNARKRLAREIKAHAHQLPQGGEVGSNS